VTEEECAAQIRGDYTRETRSAAIQSGLLAKACARRHEAARNLAALTIDEPDLVDYHRTVRGFIGGAGVAENARRWCTVWPTGLGGQRASAETCSTSRPGRRMASRACNLTVSGRRVKESATDRALSYVRSTPRTTPAVDPKALGPGSTWHVQGAPVPKTGPVAGV